MELQLGITKAEKRLVNESAEQARAQKLYDAKFNAGAKDQQMNFGMEYMKLKQQTKQLRKRDKLDSKYKEQYMALAKIKPGLEKQLETLLAENKLQEERFPKMHEEKLSLNQQIVQSLKSNKALKVQLPLNKQILDHRYAKSLIGGKSKIAYLKQKFSKTEKRDLEDEAVIQPMERALQRVTTEIAQAKVVLARQQKDYKDNNVKIVDLTKEMQFNMRDLGDKFESKHEELSKAKSMEIRSKKAKADEQDDMEEANEEKMDKKKVAAEEKEEKVVEEEEKVEKQPSETMSEEEQEQARLLKQEAKVQDRVNKRIRKAEEYAAQQVDVVKEVWQKKLQDEKNSASGKKIRNPVQDKLADEKAAVRKLSIELRDQVRP